MGLGAGTRLADLLAEDEAVQEQRGYFHTAREIAQQPETWLETAKLEVPDLRGGSGAVFLTGSGSSHYIGLSLEPILARRLERPVRAVPAGDFLTHGDAIVPRESSGICVSFARSGDSPESVAAVDWFQRERPTYHHITLTCNESGALATRYRDRAAMRTLVLDARTNDRSLVMTSSFTNLWLAGRRLAGDSLDVARVSREGRKLLEAFAWEEEPSFEAAIFLGTGSRFGAAREAALKMLEMCDGRIPSFAESFLGFRHGPMCAARERVLLVALLSADEPARAYENDLLEELAQKEALARVLRVGPGAGGATDIRAEDDELALLDVVVGQLLGLSRSLALGLTPDAPSAGKVITRVVRGFAIH